MSTHSDYVCWPNLTDHKWSTRHLSPSRRANRPDAEALAVVLKRDAGKQRLCPKLTCLFPAFAQYLIVGRRPHHPAETQHIEP